MPLYAKQIVKQINAGKYENKVLEELLKGSITLDRAVTILEKLKKS